MSATELAQEIANKHGVGQQAALSRTEETDWWDQRPVLAHIRDAAWHRLVPPSGALLCVLARVAAMLSPRTVVLFNGPASLNLGVALLGETGHGKSQSNRLAEELLPSCLPDMPETGLGSGEGLAELYMGTVTEGRRKRREQVRHNAYVYVDEGEVLERAVRELMSISG